MKGPLEINNVTKYFGGLAAVNEASLAFLPGRVTGLIGPNGAGKTTLFNLISGFLKPDSGGITLAEMKIDGLPPWKIAQLGVGRLFQDVRVYDKLAVLDNILLARKNLRGENPFFPVFRRRTVLREERENIEEARRWLDFVGLAGKKDTPAENLSYGQQKLLSLARLFAGGFDVLLLDEPTAGVHPRMIKPILDLIKRMADEGKTVVVIEHNMAVIADVSDWVYFMSEGRVVTFGFPDEILGDPEVKRAYLGV
jgi:ABC-type branched-subunit amino acid transport system ATPase component